jgi:hypothetical protein
LQTQATQAELGQINKVIVHITDKNGQYAEPIELQTWADPPSVPSTWQVPHTNLAPHSDDAQHLIMEG